MDFSRVLLVMAFFLFGLGAQASLAPAKIRVPKSVSVELKSFEPSAVVYDPTVNLFLVASDDTTKDDLPMLFVLQKDGAIQAEPVLFEGLDEMTDIESMSIDNAGEFHVMSSQSLNKKGKDKRERNLYLRGSASAGKFAVRDVVELRPLLIDAIESSVDPVMKKIAPAIEDELDVEAHFVDPSDRLMIGLKNPQPKAGTAVIVSLGKTEDVFQGHVQAKTWKTIDFAAVTKEADLLSDIAVQKDKMILTTTQEKGTGRLWMFDPTNDSLVLLQEFGKLKPEGVAFKDDDTMVVFDQGAEDAMFAFGK